MADIGDFEEFADGCSCGDPLGHHRDCIVGRPKFNGRPTALPSEETLRYRQSILQGVDPQSGKTLGRQGWQSAVEEAETAALREAWLAALGALRNTDSRFQGRSPGMWAGVGRMASRSRSADVTQWNKTLLASVRRREVLSGSDLARIRVDAASRHLTEDWESNGYMLPRSLVTDLFRIDDSSMAFQMPVRVANVLVGGLTFRKCVARWLHIASVVYPPCGATTAVAGVPSVMVVARSHPGAPRERPPTRFVRLPDSATFPNERERTAAELLRGPADALDGVVHWPADRMVAGSWAPLCVESAELAELAGRIRAGRVFGVELLGAAASAGHASPPPRPRRHFAWIDDPPSQRTLRASVAVREWSAAVLRGLKPLVDGATKSMLLVGASVRSSGQIAAVTLPVAGIGERWIPVNHRSAAEPLRIAWEKSMGVWFNSTLGILSILASGNDPADPQLTGEDVRWLPVPLFSNPQAKALAQVHDAHCTTPMLGIAEAAHDPVRLALDEAVRRVLGCDTREVSAARRLLAAEPLLN